MNIFRSNGRWLLAAAVAVAWLSGATVVMAESAPIKSADGKYDYSNVRINSLTVEQAVDEVWQKIEFEKKKGKLEMRAIQFATLSKKLNYYAQYPYIEKETKIAKTWYTKMVTILSDMFESRTNMEIAILRKDKAEFVAAKAKYVELYGQFQKLKENPEKLAKR